MQNNNNEVTNYDVVIIGGGPAGLTCGIYVARAGFKVCVIEKLYVGGQIANTNELENYPGYVNIGGADIAFKMLEQAEKQGVEVLYKEVVNTKLSDKVKKIYLADGNILTAKVVVICSGANAKKIGVPNENKFIGRGVSYCAVCDGAFYKNRTVAVIGGGNTAVGDALYLAKFAKKVYLVHRRQEFRASKVLMDKLKNENMEFVLDSVVLDIVGDNKVEGILVENKLTKETSKLPVDGVFVAIGQKPESENFISEIAHDNNGYIITDEDMKTNIEGVYCAGDVRVKKIRQVVTACADGAIAGEMANLYLTLQN